MIATIRSFLAALECTKFVSGRWGAYNAHPHALREEEGEKEREGETREGDERGRGGKEETAVNGRRGESRGGEGWQGREDGTPP